MLVTRYGRCLTRKQLATELLLYGLTLSMYDTNRKELFLVDPYSQSEVADALLRVSDRRRKVSREKREAIRNDDVTEHIDMENFLLDYWKYTAVFVNGRWCEITDGKDIAMVILEW